MKLLLDTHLLLWAAVGKLAGKARKLVADEENLLHFSAASIWEVAIKTALERQDLRVDPRFFRQALLDNGYIELSING